MSSISRTVKKRAALLGGAVIFAIWGGLFAFQEFTIASAQPAAPVQTPAVPVSVQTVNAHDVRVWSQPGKGSTFTIRLPEASPATAASLGAAQ